MKEPLTCTTALTKADASSSPRALAGNKTCGFVLPIKCFGQKEQVNNSNSLKLRGKGVKLAAEAESPAWKETVFSRNAHSSESASPSSGDTDAVESTSQCTLSDSCSNWTSVSHTEYWLPFWLTKMKSNKNIPPSLQLSDYCYYSFVFNELSHRAAITTDVGPRSALFCLQHIHVNINTPFSHQHIHHFLPLLAVFRLPLMLILLKQKNNY